VTAFVVLGIGGLGCPALLGLTAAGERRFVLVDDDVVDGSNLHRQVLFCSADVGAPKVEAARHRLELRVRGLEIAIRRERLANTGVRAFVAGLPRPAVVLECSDSPALKFALNDACLAEDVPLVVSGVLGLHGQALAVRPGATCYRCLFEAPPPRELAPACAAVGVLGSAAGIVGHLAAALALALSRGEPVAGRLVDLDLETTKVNTLEPRPRPGCPACRGQESERHGDRANPRAPAQIH
jgi:adenylyltransferase/sulfurtransferase